MALKFPDSITQNNSNYITVSAVDNDVQGIYFVDTIAERDALGLADTVLDNHRVLKAVVYVGTVPYLFDGPNVSDAEWTDASNWVQVGGTDITDLNNILNVDATGAEDGDYLIYDGDSNEWVLYNPESEVLITTDFAFDIDTFSATDFVGAVYTYTLHDFGVGARTGQFMIVTDGTEIEFTDNTTNAIGTDVDEPELTAHLSGGNVVVRVTNGNGYTFKATVTQL
jgi:hypothetical protein